MDKSVKADIDKAIRDKISTVEDNLYRANLAAKRNDVNALWGESGRTLQQIIDEYQVEKNRWTRALLQFRAWCKFNANR